MGAHGPVCLVTSTSRCLVTVHACSRCSASDQMSPATRAQHSVQQATHDSAQTQRLSCKHTDDRTMGEKHAQERRGGHVANSKDSVGPRQDPGAPLTKSVHSCSGHRVANTYEPAHEANRSKCAQHKTKSRSRKDLNRCHTSANQTRSMTHQSPPLVDVRARAVGAEDCHHASEGRPAELAQPSRALQLRNADQTRRTMHQSQSAAQSRQKAIQASVASATSRTRAHHGLHCPSVDARTQEVRGIRNAPATRRRWAGQSRPGAH